MPRKISSIRSIRAMRVSSVIFDHAGKAFRAALTARSTSSAVPSGTRAMVERSAGFSTGMKASPEDFTHSPSISWHSKNSRMTSFCSFWLLVTAGRPEGKRVFASGIPRNAYPAKFTFDIREMLRRKNHENLNFLSRSTGSPHRADFLRRFSDKRPKKLRRSAEGRRESLRLGLKELST